MMIRLREYDPDWPRAFEEAASELRRIEPGWLIEHLGSTSVPGLVAKPIIDLAIRVADRADVDSHADRLESEGWMLNHDGPPSQVSYLKHGPDGELTHIAHFYPSTMWEGANQRIFRDWLRQHPEDCERYAEAKRRAARAAESGLDYTMRKTAVIQEITDRARAARGLPSVDVWES